MAAARQFSCPVSRLRQRPISKRGRIRVLGRASIFAGGWFAFITIIIFVVGWKAVVIFTNYFNLERSIFYSLFISYIHFSFKRVAFFSVLLLLKKTLALVSIYDIITGIFSCRRHLFKQSHSSSS